VLRINAQDETAIAHLIKLYRQQEKWTELAGIYQKKIAITEDTPEIIHLGYELATIYREQLKSLYQAIDVYNDILSLNASELQAVYALKDLYNTLGKYEALEQAIQMECKLIQDVEKQKKLAVQMGEICEEKLLDYPTAIAHYETVLQHDPAYLDIIKALRRLYYKIQNYPAVVSTLDMELAASADDHIALLFEKASLCQERLLEYPRAIEAYEQILTLDNTNLTAYRALYAIHAHLEDHAQVVKILERQIQISPPDKQKELWTQSAQILVEKLHQDDATKICLRTALKLDIAYQPARSMLEVLYRRRKEWTELIALYKQEIVFNKTPERQAELYHNMARLWEIELGQYEYALDCYHHVIQLEPHNLIAIQGIQKIYQLQKRYAELLDAYQKELAVPDIETERRIWLWLTCAELQRYNLSNRDAAIRSYLAIINDLKLDPNNLIAIRGLQDLYEEKEQYKDLQIMLFKELELQKDPKRLLIVHLKLASLMEEKLQSLDVAAEHFSEAHLSRPKNLPILRRLKKLLALCKRWEAYADLVEKEIEICTRPPDLLPLHRDLLDVYDTQLSNLDKAIAHMLLSEHTIM